MTTPSPTKERGYCPGTNKDAIPQEDGVRCRECGRNFPDKVERHHKLRSPRRRGFRVRGDEERYEHPHCEKCGEHDHDPAAHDDDEDAEYCGKCGDGWHETADHGNCEFCAADHTTEQHEDDPEYEDGYIGSDLGSQGWGASLGGRALDVEWPHSEQAARHALHKEVEKSSYYPNIWDEPYGGQWPDNISKDFYAEHEDWKKDPHLWMMRNDDEYRKEHYETHGHPQDMRFSVRIKSVQGEWECVCGNIAEEADFYPCDSRTGEKVEPTIEGPWDNKSYRCDRCGLIIDQDTLQARKPIPPLKPGEQAHPQDMRYSSLELSVYDQSGVRSSSNILEHQRVGNLNREGLMNLNHLATLHGIDFNSGDDRVARLLGEHDAGFTKWLDELHETDHAARRYAHDTDKGGYALPDHMHDPTNDNKIILKHGLHLYKALRLDAAPPCPTCEGNKTAAHAACGGLGRVACNTCKGHPSTLCHTCGGEGTVALPGIDARAWCPTCKGAGGASCTTCDSTGQQACKQKECNGGQAPCTHCKGSGLDPAGEPRLVSPYKGNPWPKGVMSASCDTHVHPRGVPDKEMKDCSAGLYGYWTADHARDIEVGRRGNNLLMKGAAHGHMIPSYIDDRKLAHRVQDLMAVAIEHPRVDGALATHLDSNGTFAFYGTHGTEPGATPIGPLLRKLSNHYEVPILRNIDDPESEMDLHD